MSAQLNIIASVSTHKGTTVALSDKTVRMMVGPNNVGPQIGYWREGRDNYGAPIGICYDNNGTVIAYITNNGQMVPPNQNTNTGFSNAGVSGIGNSVATGLSMDNSGGSGFNTGSVSINPSGSNVNNPIINNQQTHVETGPVQREVAPTKKRFPLEGYEFRPIPTKYNDLELLEVGDYYKYKITIRKGESEMDLKANSELYNRLNDNSKKRDTVELVYTETEIDLNISHIPLFVDTVAKSTVYKNTLFSSVVEFGYLKSIVKGKLTDNNTSIIEVGNNYINNHLYNIVMSSENFFDIIRKLAENYPSDTLRHIRKPICEMMKEELSTIPGSPIKVDPDTFNLFKPAVITGIRDYISNLSDADLIYRLSNALNRLYDRFRNVESIRSFNVLLQGLSDDGNILEVLGFKEVRLGVVTKDPDIKIELDEMANNDSIGNAIYEINPRNTPNLYSLIDSIFIGNVKVLDYMGVENKTTFNMSDYSNATNVIMLGVYGAIFTVVRSTDDRRYTCYKRG